MPRDLDFTEVGPADKTPALGIYRCWSFLLSWIPPKTNPKLPLSEFRRKIGRLSPKRKDLSMI